MKTLKSLISRYMYMITCILVVIILMILVCIQITTEQKRAYGDATRIISQIESVLAENQKDIAVAEEEYRQTCIHNAETVARIIESNPKVLEDADELKEIAISVEIDEIHIFDATGRIFAGTHPEYYNYTVDSGEQIMFFKPMLEDKTLKLVQDITPNTAEEKPMQYSAVWSASGKYIVQVGIEPVHVMKATEKNELSYIFSLFRVNPNANYYAVDEKSGLIVGSTDLDSVGLSINEIGVDMSKMQNDKDGFHAKINGEWAFCVFEQSGDNYIGRVITIRNLYQRVPTTAFWIFVSLLIVSFILARAVVRYMNRYVVMQIDDVNDKLQAIADGNLEEKLDMSSSVEFVKLSSYINLMVKSLLENSKKVSYVLSKTNMHIGTYEYGKHMKKVRYTEYVPKIFSLTDEKMKELANNPDEFVAFLESIKKNPVMDEPGVYQFGEQFVRLEEISGIEEQFGVAIDVTTQMFKRLEIEKERDIDSLTGLYNRRGLDNHLEELFANPQKLGYSAIIMIDADGLKGINDTYGHEKGDVYLKKIASIINNFGIRNSIASRQGGDEYVLFLYDYESEAELVKTIETLEYIQNNSTAHLDDNVNIPLRFSMGYCMTNGATDYHQLLKEADEKMYKNKLERRKNK